MLIKANGHLRNAGSLERGLKKDHSLSQEQWAAMNGLEQGIGLWSPFTVLTALVLGTIQT